MNPRKLKEDVTEVVQSDQVNESEAKTADEKPEEEIKSEEK